MIGTPQMLKHVNESNVTIKIGTDIIHLVESVQNLGFHMDRYFKNTTHQQTVLNFIFNTQKNWKDQTSTGQKYFKNPYASLTVNKVRLLQWITPRYY